jgi:polyisoprenoid-binding protein YceI
MKRLALFTGILALAAPLALAQTSTWSIDSAHSEVDFTVRHRASQMCMAASEI